MNLRAPNVTIDVSLRERSENGADLFRYFLRDLFANDFVMALGKIYWRLTRYGVRVAFSEKQS